MPSRHGLKDSMKDEIKVDLKLIKVKVDRYNDIMKERNERQFAWHVDGQYEAQLTGGRNERKRRS